MGYLHANGLKSRKVDVSAPINHSNHLELGALEKFRARKYSKVVGIIEL
jgi:hypothetical protein